MARSLREMVQNLILEGYLKTPRIIEAFLKVDRRDFVPENLKEYAYVDEPLPIGAGQTISAPHMVAWMTELINPQPGEKILEVGTGSGYQAAILAELVKPGGKVITVERIRSLYEIAKERLKKYENVIAVWGDGWEGYPPEAPYDKIVVTACASRIPEKLIEQLKDGGIMVFPLGGKITWQDLILAKKENGKIKMEKLGKVAFVPMEEGVI